jgi:hypothetical protein
MKAARTVAKNGTKGHISHGLDRRAARNEGKARDAIIAACKAVKAAHPELVKDITRIMRKTCRCSLQDARDGAVLTLIGISMHDVYVGRPGAL